MTHFLRLFLLLQTCTPKWQTSFLRDPTPAVSNVSIDIDMIRMQGKATETRKTAILTEKNKHPPPPKKKQQKKTTTKKKKKKKTTDKSNHIWNKKFYVNSTEMYMTFACLLQQNLYLNSEDVILCLIFIQPGACSARYWLVSAQQSWPIRKQKHRKGINFYRCFDLLLRASCKNILSKQCNRES